MKENKLEYKFLRLWIQNYLKWDTHINQLSSKLCSISIRTLIGSTSLKSVRIANLAYTHSILNYEIIKNRNN